MLAIITKMTLTQGMATFFPAKKELYNVPMS